VNVECNGRASAFWPFYGRYRGYMAGNPVGMISLHKTLGTSLDMRLIEICQVCQVEIDTGLSHHLPTEYGIIPTRGRDFFCLLHHGETCSLSEILLTKNK